MMKPFALPIALLLLSAALAGQVSQRADSLRRVLTADSARIFRKTIAKPYLRLENRKSFIARENIDFLGFLAGANLYERHVLSAGYYFLDKRSAAPIFTDRNTGSVQEFSKLNYAVFSYQYIIVNARYVQLNLPFEVGFGGYSAKYSDGARTADTLLHGSFLPIGGGFQAIFKPLKWLGVSGSGGYRHVKHDAIGLHFNGFYYSYGLWVDARYLIRSLRYTLAKNKYRRNIALLPRAGQ